MNMNVFFGGSRNTVVRSVFDNKSAIMQGIKLFIRTDKRVAKELSEYQHFRCDDSDQKRGPMPNLQGIHPALLNNPDFIERTGRKAVTVEHQTILGRIRRVAPFVHDPQFRAYFKDAFRLSKTAMVYLLMHV